MSPDRGDAKASVGAQIEQASVLCFILLSARTFDYCLTPWLLCIKFCSDNNISAIDASMAVLTHELDSSAAPLLT